jgi:hypothetical protein
MLQDIYLEKGITALARAGYQNPMAGHIGAAVLAAYFFSHENKLDEGAISFLQGVVDDSMEKDRQGWLAGAKDPTAITEIFSPYPQEQSNPDLVQDIITALDKKIDHLRQSGHCTIFASLALKALKHKADMVTPSITDGICQLIDSFNDSPGQGYYGQEQGWLKGVPVEPDKYLVPYQGSSDLVHAAFGEMARHDKIKRTGYGNLVHLVTHTNALVELDEMGYNDLALRGHDALRTHIMLLRSLPPDRDSNDQTTYLEPTASSPLSTAYWENFNAEDAVPSALGQGGAGHALKVSYAFFHIVSYIKDKDRRNEHIGQIGYLT